MLTVIVDFLSGKTAVRCARNVLSWVAQLIPSTSNASQPENTNRNLSFGHPGKEAPKMDLNLNEIFASMAKDPEIQQALADLDKKKEQEENEGPHADQPFAKQLLSEKLKELISIWLHLQVESKGGVPFIIAPTGDMNDEHGFIAVFMDESALEVNFTLTSVDKQSENHKNTCTNPDCHIKNGET